MTPRTRQACLRLHWMADKRIGHVSVTRASDSDATVVAYLVW
jgi:hypothetical protein